MGIIWVILEHCLKQKKHFWTISITLILIQSTAKYYVKNHVLACLNKIQCFCGWCAEKYDKHVRLNMFGSGQDSKLLVFPHLKLLHFFAFPLL